MRGSLGFGLWSVRFPLVLVRTGRRLPVQALCERRVLVALTGYPRGGAPGPGRSFVTRSTRNQREIWYMESGPSRVNAPLKGPVIPRSRRSLSKTKASEIREETMQTPMQTGGMQGAACKGRGGEGRWSAPGMVQCRGTCLDPGTLQQQYKPAPERVGPTWQRPALCKGRLAKHAGVPHSPTHRRRAAKGGFVTTR